MTAAPASTQLELLAEQLFQTFKSQPRGFATSWPTGAVLRDGKRDGKVAYEYRTQHRAVTVDDWRRHLLGEPRSQLVLLPLLDDGTVYWGCVDVDEIHGNSAYDQARVSMKLYRFDMERHVVNLNANNKLGLSCHLSKSGGLHIFKIVAQPIPATRMREFLSGVAGLLGLPNTVEIFPKSDVPDPGGLPGGYVNVPYYGACKEASNG
jgi:hypothetical protein